MVIPSTTKNLGVDDQGTSIEANSPKVVPHPIIFWNVKKKRSPCKREEKKSNTKQVFEGIVNEIKCLAKDEKEEQQFMEVADLVCFMRNLKTMPHEIISEIKKKYCKAEQVERPNVEPPFKRRRKELQTFSNFSDQPSSSKGVGFMNSSRNSNSEKPNCQIKRKFENARGKRVVQKKIEHEKLVKEAEKREENPPSVVVRKMVRMNGSNLKFLMEKPLLDTDMSKYHDRISMPKLQVAREFLNEEENEKIKSGIIDVKVIEPCDLESSLVLCKWKSGSEVYALRSGWRDIAKREENGLDNGMKVQIWCFRNENSQLCFQIVKADDADENLEIV